MNTPKTRAEARTLDANGNPTAVPQPKVIAATAGAGVGAAAATVIIWIIEATIGVDIPEGVELAGGVLLTAAVSFAAGYLRRPSA